MKYLSVCSGIEAATVAWHSLGWEAAAYSEIEAFPSAVLAHHYPDVPNVGDMTKFKEWNIEPGSIDLLVGGTPCQSFSVAGLRKGLDDPRGNLALTYCAILDHFKPRWFVWENVPGVLSSGGGRDFGSFLGAVAELGYGFAYRVLDAQYFGVAQRRRRVFVVGHLGDWRSAAAVLFERDCLRRDTAPSRKAREAIAPCVTNGPPFSRTGNERVECEAIVQVCPTLRAGGNRTGGDRPPGTDVDTADSLIPVTAQCITTGTGQRYDTETETETILPIALQDITPREKAQNGRGWNDDGTAYTVDTHATQGVAVAIGTDCYNGTITGDVAATIGTPGSSVNASGPTVMQATAAVVAPALTAANNPSRSPQSSEVTQQIWSVMQATAAVARPIGLDEEQNAMVDAFGTLKARTAGGGFEGSVMTTAMQVRRLTPVECERLQGFPDNYTAIPWRKKPAEECPDGPRYKALGNSMAVPVMAWIGKRIKEVEAINAS